MHDAKVTIIVGIYNSEKFLRKGLESIRKQTWDNIEILLMDDGSTDNSSTICDEYVDLDKRFVAIHKENSGVCDSRNQALDIASGDYVCFMDGDDWLSSDFVEYMMGIIDDTGTKMAVSDQIFTTRDQTQSDNDTIEIWESEKIITNIIYLNMTLGPWSKMYSMDLIRKHAVRFPAHWFGETLHFANNVAFYSEKVGVGHRKVYNYRLNNPESGVTKNDVQNWLLSLENVKALYKCQFANTESIRRAINWHIYDNYYLLIQSIIGAEAIDKYQNEFEYAKRYLKQHFFSTYIKSEVGFKRKMLIIIEAYAPVLLSKRRIRRLHNAFIKDNME